MKNNKFVNQGDKSLSGIGLNAILGDKSGEKSWRNNEELNEQTHRWMNKEKWKGNKNKPWNKQKTMKEMSELSNEEALTK